MRFLRFSEHGEEGLAVVVGNEGFGRTTRDHKYPGDLSMILGLGPEGLKKAADHLAGGEPVDLKAIRHLPPVGLQNKVLCMGINYMQHVKETHMEVPKYPTIFTRYESSFVGHGEKLVRPKVSEQLDYEGELVIIVGKPGRYIPKGEALNHVAGYSIFNDGTIRDYQFQTTQWTIGKNFDQTGSFGPHIVTADELPAGASGLLLQTRLNGQVVQKARTDDLLFDVASIITYISKGIALKPGDAILTGTPPGVGWARKPQLFMKGGDTCEVEIEGIGTLSNSIDDEK